MNLVSVYKFYFTTIAAQHNNNRFLYFPTDIVISVQFDCQHEFLIRGFVL